MRRLVLPLVQLLFVLTVCSPGLFADDGSWSSDFRLTQGPVYSQTENRDIALEKEILAFDGFDSGVTRAIFYFHNTASSDRKVEAGFPVLVQIGLDEDAVPTGEGRLTFFLSQSKYEQSAKGLEYAQLVLGSALKQAPPDTDTESHSPFYVDRKDVPGRLQLDAGKVSGLFDFSITQDGAPVPYDYVVVESAIVDGGNGSHLLDLTFHFHHMLTFAAGAQSVVKVTYSSDYLSGRENTGRAFLDQYAYTYILETGRTWKGPIGQLYLGVPPEMTARLPRAFVPMGRVAGKDLYLAEGYKPAVGDGVELEAALRPIPSGYLHSIWFDDPLERDAPAKPAQDFVTVLGASSFLKETAPVYTDEGVISKSRFGPLSLFDGVRQTAWCVRDAADGIGAWVEFNLSRDVQGLVIQNGFNMSFEKIEGKTIDTYYEKNNRPKDIEIVSSDQKLRKTIQLADTQDLQEFDLVPLPKGTYRLYIRSIYAGTKYHDTCLGELTFIPATPRTSQLLQDSFLQGHLSDLTGK